MATGMVVSTVTDSDSAPDDCHLDLVPAHIQRQSSGYRVGVRSQPTLSSSHSPVSLGYTTLVHMPNLLDDS